MAISSVDARNVGCAGRLRRRRRRLLRSHRRDGQHHRQHGHQTRRWGHGFFFPGGTIPLPVAHLVRQPVELHGNLAPTAVACVVGRAVQERVLVRQLLDDVGKHLVELLDRVDEEGPPAAHLRHARHHLREVAVPDAPAEADGVDGRVAGLEPCLDALERRDGILVLAVTEDDQRTASRLLADGVERGEHGVKQRRAAPRREPIDRARPAARDRSTAAPR